MNYPDRHNDEYPHAKHVWKFFAAAYVVYCVACKLGL